MKGRKKERKERKTGEDALDVLCRESERHPRLVVPGCQSLQRHAHQDSEDAEREAESRSLVEGDHDEVGDGVEVQVSGDVPAVYDARVHRLDLIADVQQLHPPGCKAVVGQLLEALAERGSRSPGWREGEDQQQDPHHDGRRPQDATHDELDEGNVTLPLDELRMPDEVGQQGSQHDVPRDQ